MKMRALVLSLLPLLFGAAGCAAHNGSYLYSNSRKLFESEVPLVVQVVASPLTLVPETVFAPVCAYYDATHEAEVDPGHRNAAYLGLRTFNASDLGGGYLILGFLPVFAVDTVLLPITLLVDTGYALSN